MSQSLVGQKYCHGCGRPVHVEAEICPNCGVRVGRKKGTKTKTTAAILAFFLGGLGAHKFYLGRPLWGIIYLLFFWTLIPALIAFIEIFILLAMDEEKFDEKFN